MNMPPPPNVPYPPQWSPAPPPYPYMMMPPPRRSSFWKRLFVVVTMLVLVGSVLLNLILLVANSCNLASSAEQKTIVSGEADQKVAVIPLSGVISQQTAEQFDKLVTQAQDDENVKALVVQMDTPGGEVTASDEMYHRLLAFKAARKGAPVIVSMGALGTSGGYYVACAADEIIAQRTTLTGNIGVLLPRWNFSKFGEKYGIQDSSIAATGTPYKTVGSAWKEETPEETAYIRGLLDSAFSEFRIVVDSGRKGKLKKPLEEIADGRAFSAPEARSLGLIDSLGYLGDACDRAAALAKLTKKTVVRYERTPTMLQLMGLARSSVESPSAAMAGAQSDSGVTLRIDSSFLHDLITPRPLYLWRGE